jgi:hypothetical protein
VHHPRPLIRRQSAFRSLGECHRRSLEATLPTAVRRSSQPGHQATASRPQTLQRAKRTDERSLSDLGRLGVVRLREVDETSFLAVNRSHATIYGTGTLTPSDRRRRLRQLFKRVRITHLIQR